MRKLFEIDKKNYIENGTVGKRPSVRGIIIRDGKVAMLHSRKYNYYKLPGGGIEADETLEETLVREVKEESGLVVKTETIQEYGYVRRVEKGRFEDKFIQENYYFLCDVEDNIVSQNLDDYEEFEEFELEFVAPLAAIEMNHNADHKEKANLNTFQGMIERENRVLELIRSELYPIDDNKNALLANIHKLHTTELGIERIRRNLQLQNENVVEYCKQKIEKENSQIYKQGKNWYCEVDGIKITVNSYSYTIITAHRIVSE